MCVGEVGGGGRLPRRVSPDDASVTRVDGPFCLLVSQKREDERRQGGGRAGRFQARFTVDGKYSRCCLVLVLGQKYTPINKN